VQAGVERTSWRDEQSGVMMTAIASVAPPRLPFEAPATSLAQSYAAQLRESRDRGWTARDAAGASASQGQLGFVDASPRMWAQSIKDRVRTARAAEAELTARAAHALSKVADADRASSPPSPLDAAPLDDVQLAEGSTPTPTPGFFSTLRYMGQLDLTYLVCEGDGELILIDQHIAHERVELARLKAMQHERDVVPTQRMLFPQTIDVKPELVELATKMSGVLAQVGYEAEGFGKHTLAVKAVPGGIRHGDPTQLLRELLTEWADEGTPTEAERLERVLAEIACHSVVRAGDRLSPSEAEALLRSMDGADFSTHGPHGRPVLLRLPLAEIARRFGR
jgi:DNA mismatch repair ATPase MutL